MTDTPKRLAGPQAVTTSDAVVYTVPSATATIVRSIHVTNLNALTSYTVSVGINGAANVQANQFIGASFVPPGGDFDWSGFLVLDATDTLHVIGSSVGNLTITISGVEVS